MAFTTVDLPCATCPIVPVKKTNYGEKSKRSIEGFIPRLMVACDFEMRIICEQLITFRELNLSLPVLK